MVSGGEMKSCEVCGELNYSEPLELGEFPLCDDLLPIGSLEKVPTYSQSIVLCKTCLTAHQKFPVVKTDLFKPNYHYRAALTRDVLSGMSDLVSHVAGKIPQKSNLLVLDVGCNDGSLLSIFKEKLSATVIGVDPTDAIDDAKGKIDKGYKEFFNKSVALEILENHGFPDVITFTNVFAHIENLPELLESVSVLMGESTLLVIENHYLGKILERSQFDTFYHEHPRTYSAKSFLHIANSLGVNVNEIIFPSRYGGNIRVTLSRTPRVEKDIDHILSLEEDFAQQFSNMTQQYLMWVDESRAQLEIMEQKGGVIGKALPGRAVMLIKALSIDSSFMPVVYEQSNSPKLGHYVPGTEIEIRPDSELVNSEGRIIVWAWHIIDEVVEQLRSIGFRGEVWAPLPKLSLYTVL
jgi:SAM-dependent methyltransferase